MKKERLMIKIENNRSQLFLCDMNELKNNIVEKIGVLFVKEDVLFEIAEQFRKKFPMGVEIISNENVSYIIM